MVFPYPGCDGYSRIKLDFPRNNAKGKVVWQKTGLRSPISAQRLNNGNTLIAEHSGARVIEVDRKGQIVWQKTGLKSP